MFGDNFTRTWDQLVARYKNKRILINAYLNSLMDTRKVKNENSVDIKRLLGDVKEALGALETLGCPVQHWDLIVIFLMV